MAQQNGKKPAKKAARPKKNKKIIRYRKPLNINVGMIIFALIFVYMVFSIYSYARRDKVRFYEVSEGSIVNHSDYTGIILREEKVKTADRSGYINYYIREGKRASVGTRIYSIDETGSIASYLEENSGDGITLTGKDLADLKKELTVFSLTYDDDSFHTVYDTKYTLDSNVAEYMNFNALDSAGSLLDEAGINFQQVRADAAGVVSYGIDSYESLDVSSITASVFDRSTYAKATTKSALVESGVPVYKLITSDLWSVVFPLDGDKPAFADQKTLTVSFTGRGITAEGAFSIFTSVDGGTYGKLDFDKYMVQFASDRYVNFEIMTDKVDGLKIPVTAVTNKDFYLVPVDYLTKGGDTTDQGFNKEVYTESGSSVVFVPTDIYYQDGDSYYIEIGDGENGFRAGDYIVKPDSTDRYQIGASASLQGVYNINKGYAVFKQIEILISNDEYYTVKKNMSYGLSVYDHIVLDASTVSEGELIYQ